MVMNSAMSECVLLETGRDHLGRKMDAAGNSEESDRLLLRRSVFWVLLLFRERGVAFSSLSLVRSVIGKRDAPRTWRCAAPLPC